MSIASLPHEKIVAQVKDYIETRFLIEFGADDIGVDTDLFDAGVVDSFGMVDVISFVESTFEVALSDDDITSPLLASVAGLAELVSSKLDSAA